MLILAVFIVLNVLFKVLILLTLDFNYIYTCLMWATVSALLCLVCPVLLLFYSCVFPACFVEQINGYGYGCMVRATDD